MVKELLNISCAFGGNFLVELCLLFGYLLRVLSDFIVDFLLQVELVPNHIDFDLRSPRFTNKIYPFVETFS